MKTLLTIVGAVVLIAFTIWLLRQDIEIDDWR